MTSPWQPGWQEILKDCLLAKGFGNLTEFLAVFPAIPYENLGEKLQMKISTIQILHVQFEEARINRTVEPTTRDILAREIAGYLPEGWGCGEDAESQSMMALSAWVTDLTVTGQFAELERPAMQICQHLMENPPVRGWIPSGPEDPVISELFEMYWPRNDV